jgi:adenylylsulfate kinase-like enzyme
MLSLVSTPLVLHLNGPPGVGKSTLARLWADAHPGTLLLDPDALRTWVSGWRDDFASTGAAIRPVALAMLAAYVANGGDVVLPQLIANAEELARFERAAVDAGGWFIEVFLEAEDVAERFWSRARDEPWLEQVHELVAQAPPGHLDDYTARLTALAAGRPDAVRLTTTTGDIDAAYEQLVALVSQAHRPR